MMLWLVVVLAVWQAIIGLASVVASISPLGKILGGGFCALTVYALASYAVTLR